LGSEGGILGVLSSALAYSNVSKVKMDADYLYSSSPGASDITKKVATTEWVVGQLLPNGTANYVAAMKSDATAPAYKQLVGTLASFVHTNTSITVKPAQFLEWTFVGLSNSVLVATTGIEKTIQTGCTIDEVSYQADVAGTVALEVQRSAASGSPSFSTISATTGLTASRYATVSSFTGWTTAVPSTSVLRVNITGTPSTLTKLHVKIRCS
jgi:hypothetical protein